MVFTQMELDSDNIDAMKWLIMQLIAGMQKSNAVTDGLKWQVTVTDHVSILPGMLSILEENWLQPDS